MLGSGFCPCPEADVNLPSLLNPENLLSQARYDLSRYIGRYDLSRYIGRMRVMSVFFLSAAQLPPAKPPARRSVRATRVTPSLSATSVASSVIFAIR
jgi:hypothetical protein